MPKLSLEKMAEMIKLLGKEHDTTLAEKFNTTRQNVAKHRTARNIPPFIPEPPMTYPVPVCFTKKDESETKQAMKKLGEKNRSGYIRGAVREKNKGVLGK